MSPEVFVHRSHLDFPAEEVFGWHTRPGSLQRYTPPWVPLQLVEQSGGLENGGRAVFRVRAAGRWWRWTAEHRDYQPPRQFRDVQVEGPFAHWEHLHRVEPENGGGCTLEDRIEYAMPLGGLGRLVAGGHIRRQLDRTFAYRHRLLRDDLAAQHRYAAPPLKLLVSGAGGLVGSALMPFLTTAGHRVLRLVRRPPADPSAILWDPAGGKLEAAPLEGLDGVIHLAGESIAAGRWTAARKARIRDSRVQGTRLLAETLARLERPPKVLVCASAIGYYGDRGDEVLTENAASGQGFLAEVCRQWEEAARPARERGIRVLHLRFGVILSPKGGALAKMLLPFRMGAGGVIGSGRQCISWISLDDTLGAIQHALHTTALQGPVNVTAPEPVTNREYTRTLGRVLRRPTVFPMPALAARLVFGEMADELLLASTRVVPTRLQETGYVFRYPQLEEALRWLLGRF